MNTNTNTKKNQVARFVAEAELRAINYHAQALLEAVAVAIESGCDDQRTKQLEDFACLVLDCMAALPPLQFEEEEVEA